MNRRIAHYTDPDLDFHIVGAVLVSVAVLDREFLVTAHGGIGRWYDQNLGQLTDVHDAHDGVFTFGFHNQPGVYDLVHAMTRQLVQWRDQAVPLRIVSAPGADTCIDDTHGVRLPIPRGPHHHN